MAAHVIQGPDQREAESCATNAPTKNGVPSSRCCPISRAAYQGRIASARCLHQSESKTIHGTVTRRVDQLDPCGGRGAGRAVVAKAESGELDSVGRAKAQRKRVYARLQRAMAVPAARHAGTLPPSLKLRRTQVLTRRSLVRRRVALPALRARCVTFEAPLSRAEQHSMMPGRAWHADPSRRFQRPGAVSV